MSEAERKPRFRDRHPELVWSNSQASDEVFIRRALLDPLFDTLLEAAAEFGIDKLEQEWRALTADPTAEVQRAATTTNRILRNLRLGYEQALPMTAPTHSA